MARTFVKKEFIFLQLDFYFYEYLTNVYKRGFIEMHLKFCDFIHKDKFFGQQMRQGNLSKPCPYPPVSSNNYYLLCCLGQRRS